MSSAHSVPPETAHALRADVTGLVFLPGDPGYGQARQAWQLRKRSCLPTLTSASSRSRSAMTRTMRSSPRTLSDL